MTRLVAALVLAAFVSAGLWRHQAVIDMIQALDFAATVLAALV